MMYKFLQLPSLSVSGGLGSNVIMIIQQLYRFDVRKGIYAQHKISQ